MTAGRDSGRDVDMRLLELLACPLTKGPLVWNADRGELVSKAARLAYPVRDGIPIMLSSEARALSDDES
ncbi:Trm112 family protein [Mesorhizobium sp. 8]|uniref:Trm112 family protein n=1 Tax=Mesorhizobium sp. 8 TaxID=2584466 RepID=UPI00111CBCAC|nr:Trm112 family protein [Mesorhizobium sp. 8]QDC01503.1 Trm112 family protein [Mesorhizobium sp. 8]